MRGEAEQDEAVCQLAMPSDQLARLSLVLWHACFHVRQPELVRQLPKSYSTAAH